MSPESPAKILEDVPRPLRPAITPLVKWAFGVACGVVCALGLALPAAYHAAFDPESHAVLLIYLLGGNFLPGYGPTWTGALLAVPGGLALGFGAGFLLALLRNRMVALWVFWVSARERLKESSKLLDNM